MLVLTWELRYFRKRGNKKRVRRNRRLRIFCTLYIGVSRKFYLYTLYTYVLAKILQNGAKFIQKLTLDFKNHMRSLDNSRQAVESLKIWNLMGYLCPKNTFLQLKHIRMIYLTLLWMSRVKIYQTPYSIAVCNRLKFSFSSSGSFAFCQTFELFAEWFLISYDIV